jgi:hypothetical protein
MPRLRHGCSLAIAPWIVAGALLLGGTGAVAAQDALPMSALITASSPAQPAGHMVDAAAGGGEAMELSQVASAEVGSDAMTGGGSYALGALVGAVVAAVAALRERFTRR